METLDKIKLIGEMSRTTGYRLLVRTADEEEDEDRWFIHFYKHAIGVSGGKVIEIDFFNEFTYDIDKALDRLISLIKEKLLK
jgi:hypothetical protein